MGILHQLIGIANEVKQPLLEFKKVIRAYAKLIDQNLNLSIEEEEEILH